MQKIFRTNHRTARHPLRLTLIAALAASWGVAASAAGPDGSAPATQTLDALVVTGSRVEHTSFDLPASINVLTRQNFTEGQARVNASEALVAVPGLVVQNRQNYAQDLQISSRGFGARSAFGVHGVRLLADGIPATMPDGQGQAATFNLDMAERIEVLRGPFSALYGNHAGGVIQLFTREPRGAPSVETSAWAGSDGSWKIDTNAEGKPGMFGYLLDVSRFHTDGFREHSAATRDQGMAKLVATLDADSRLTLVANGLRQKDTQDPLGLTWAAAAANPRAADAAALNFNTRKSIGHQQAGAVYEKNFGSAGVLQASVYGGNRQVIQYQAIPIVAQINPRSSGGVIDFDRNFGGVDVHWSAVRPFAGGSLTATAGVDYERSSDDRQGYENFIGTQLGVTGALRRDEQDVVTGRAVYLQTEWRRARWSFTAGLRHSQVGVRVDDRYLTNGNDSGSLDFASTTPALGVLYALTPTVNLHASAARGFETPTLNELFYSSGGGAFNFTLKPSRSAHLEAGAKAYLGEATRMNLALFQVNTDDELVVDSASGGRTSYRNASKTLRRGTELSLDSRLSHGFSSRLALTFMRAIYDSSFTSGGGTAPVVVVAAGNRLPGVPAASLYGELAWEDKASGLSAALEGAANGKVYVEDSNREKAAPGYAVFSVRLGAEQRVGGWRIKQFARVNNLFDRNIIGSVIVGDSNKRYYEPAPGRNWLLGGSAQYVF